MFINILNIPFPFEKQIVSFLLWIDSVGYSIFSYFYKTFIKLAQQELFQADAFQKVYDNLYLIFGVIALFMVSYILLKSMVDPDNNQSNKQLRDMGVRFILCLILTILLPTIFDFLIDVQNAILERNVVPKAILDSQIIVQVVDENGNNIGNEQYIDQNNINLTSDLLQIRSNEMVATIIGGLMYPLKTDKDAFDGERAEPHKVNGVYHYYESWNNENSNKEWTTDVSEWWDGSAKTVAMSIGCGVGIAGTILLTVATGGAAAAAGSTALVVAGSAGATATVGGVSLISLLLSCIAGGGIALSGGELAATISAHEFTWTNALEAITTYGNFSQITLFAQDIVDGRFHYTPIISTIVVGLLVYMIVSFCFDVVVRQAKLIFYQLLGPLCFMMSVLPSKKDLLKNWFKVVVTTWLEIFIRIAVLCFVVLLVGNLNLDNLTSIFHPTISAFIVLGIILFAKQIPKLFKDLTGLDSGNMKLNLKEKLSDSGAYAFAGVALGGAKRLSRGITSGIKKNYEQKDGKWQRKNGVSLGTVIKSGVAGGFSAVPGTVATQINSGRAGYKAKSWKDMMSGVNNAVSKSEATSQKFSKYINDNGGTVGGVTKALGKDAFDLFLGYIGFEPDFSVLKEQKEAVDEISKTLKAMKAVSEDYIDKHKHEFFSAGGTIIDTTGKQVEVTKNLIDDYQEWVTMNERAAEATKKGNTAAAAQYTQLAQKLEQAALSNNISFKSFAKDYQNNRLDIMEARIEELKKNGGSAYDIAEATNAFNKARKDLVDNFITDSQKHKGSEQEASILRENIGMLNKQLEDLSTSAVVKTFHDGVEGIFDGVTETRADVKDATDFVKSLKKATEVTEANINRQYNELQRRNAKKPGNKSN